MARKKWRSAVVRVRTGNGIDDRATDVHQAPGDVDANHQCDPETAVLIEDRLDNPRDLTPQHGWHNNRNVALGLGWPQVRIKHTELPLLVFHSAPAPPACGTSAGKRNNIDQERANLGTCRATWS